MMMMMMMMMTMTTKYRIKHSVICLCQSAVVVVVVLLIIMWWWWDVNDHHHMYRVLWRIYSRSFSYQGRVIAATLFGIFSSLLLSYPFDSSTDGVYLHTCTEGKLFNLARLCAKTKVKTVFGSEMLFADNAYRGNIAEAYQQIRQRMWKLWPLNQSQEDQCECLGCQPSPWNTLEAVDKFTYLGSTVSMNMSKTQKSPEEPPAPCLNWPREPGETNTWLKESKCTCTRNAFSASCSMAVKLGPPTQDRNTAWTLSICDVSGASSASSGKTTSPTVKHCHVLKPKHVLHSQSASPEMARAYSSHGRWTHPQRRPILTIDDRSQASRAPCSAVQGREQTWPQRMQNSSKQLWRCQVSSFPLETVKEWGN